MHRIISYGMTARCKMLQFRWCTRVLVQLEPLRFFQKMNWLNFWGPFKPLSFLKIFFTVFIEFVTVLFLFSGFFFFLALWHVGSWSPPPHPTPPHPTPPRDRTHTPCFERWSFNHWITEKSYLQALWFLLFHYRSSKVWVWDHSDFLGLF